MNIDELNEARSAFDNATWRASVRVDGWDCYLFDGDRLQVFPVRGKAGSRVELHLATVRLVRLHAYPHEQEDVEAGSIGLDLTVPESMEVLDLRLGLTKRFVLNMRTMRSETPSSLLASGLPRGLKKRPNFTLYGGTFKSAKLVNVVAELEPARADLAMTLQNSSALVPGGIISGLVVGGRSDLKTDNLNVKFLRFTGTARLDLQTTGHSPGRVKAMQVTSASIDQPPGVAHIARGCQIDARDISDLSLHLELGAQLTVSGEASKLTVEGPGAVVIEKRAIGLTFGGLGEDPASYPQLQLRRHAIVQNASGGARLGQVANAQINGNSSTGFTIVQLLDEAGPDATSGLVVRELHVPVSLAGLQTLGTLADTAAVAIPDVTGRLPGSGQWRVRDLLKVRDFAERSVQLWRGQVSITSDDHLKADYASALARLGETKGSPGSVRTKLAWLEYRTRQTTSRGGVERTTLAAYRALGYGERAGPPLALAVALAVAIALGVLLTRSLDLSQQGVLTASTYIWDWISSPLHVLRLTEKDEIPLGTSRWVFVGRIAIAIPFVTGLLALRKYVKRNVSSD